MMQLKYNLNTEIYRGVMQIYTGLNTKKLADIPALAKKAEDLGFDGVGFGEVSVDAFLPATLSASSTSRLLVGTSISLAFVRSPMATAYTSWGIQELSNGRFELGLGTQVKAHNERRFSVPWVAPAPRLRELVNSIRAIWDCWQNGTTLNFQGEHYNFNLMPPEFNPGPLACGIPKINIAAMNTNMVQLAGEVGDGFLPHGFNTSKYVNEITLPELETGAKRAGRTLKDFTISGGGFIASGLDDKEVARQFEVVRRRISFYGSTRAYRPVLEVHGWEKTGDQLREMSKNNQWDEMPGLVTDEMVEAFALVGNYKDLPDMLKKRYHYASRINLEFPKTAEAEEEILAAMAAMKS